MSVDRLVSIVIGLSGVLVAVVQGLIARKQNRANEGLTTAQATEIIQRAASAMVEDQAEQLTELRKRLAEMTAEFAVATEQVSVLRRQAASLTEDLRVANRTIALQRALLSQHGIAVPEAS